MFIIDQLIMFLPYYGREEELSAYGKENWFPLFEDIMDYWHEENGEVRPGFFELDETIGYEVSELIDELQVAFWNTKEYELCMKLCKDVLDAYDFTEDTLNYHNMKRFYGEALAMVKGKEEAKKYLDEWQKEEPGSAYVIASFIDFYMTNKDYPSALELAEKHMHMELKDDGDDWLYDACENLYEELGDKAKIKEVKKLRDKYYRNWI